MKIVIIGDGKVGDTIAEYLSDEGHDLTIIDTNQKIIDGAMNRHDVLGIVGNGASNTVQTEADVQHADVVISATSSDELNLVACLTAKKLGADNTIARVRNPEYSEQISFMCSQLGLDMIVNPEFETAMDIVRAIRFSAAIKIETFANDKVDLAEINISRDSPLAGKKLSDLKSDLGINILICAVKRGDEVYIPTGDFILEADDNIHLTAPHTELASLFKKIGLASKKIKSVFIVGGSKVAHYLADSLIKLGISVKLFESKLERCVALSALIPKATVIHGDGTDSDLLAEEGLASADACISLTDIDEQNIITSLFAKTLGVEKIITKITRQSFAKMLPSMGLGSCTVVSPKDITANNILRYVRAVDNASGSSIQCLYKIVDNKVEAIEFSATERFRKLSTQLKDIHLRQGVLIACITRKNSVQYPNGFSTIEVGDRVVVVTTHEALTDLNDILE